MDHLDGVLLIERLDADQRREAKQILRQRNLELSARILTDCTNCWVTKCVSPSSARPRRRCRRCARSSMPDTTSSIVITRPDRKRGRGGELSPSPVKACAQESRSAVAHRLSDLDDLDVERGVVVAYGRLIPGRLLARRPDAERSLLVAAAVARRRAGRAGDPRRRRRDRREHHDRSTSTSTPARCTSSVAWTIGDKTLATLLGELAHVGRPGA